MAPQYARLARNFNPRTPVGCDCHKSYLFSFPRHFNPRTPVGCDPRASPTGSTAVLFQSTHPSGVRLVQQCASFGNGNFNPRTPVGCDGVVGLKLTLHEHFNPRTPVGCDHGEADGRVFDDISIHAPQWGATFSRMVPETLLFVFQSTHPSGVRPEKSAVVIKPKGISIHAPQWGATGI